MMIPLPRSVYRAWWRSAVLLALAAGPGAAPVRAGEFEVLGSPVKATMVAASAAGIDEKGEEVFYFSCAQPGSHLFLLQVNPRTDTARQWPAPVGEGAWALAVAPDHSVYLGTWESGYLLRFDPRHPEAGIKSLGKPSASETYIWDLAFATNQLLYGCTYPQARLVRYDPQTAAAADLGRLDPHEMYARWIAADTNGLVFVSIGTVRGQVVCHDPRTGHHRPLIPEADRPRGTPRVYLAADGRVYASFDKKPFRCAGDRLEPMQALPGAARPRLRDGRELSKVAVERGAVTYQLQDPGGNVVRKTAPFDGAAIGLFEVGAGPGGRVFGSTALPLELFEFNPATRQLTDLGNPTDVDGEIYSFATAGGSLYVCAYPSSFLSVYDPARPWHYGRSKDSNPRGLGYMGDGHLRPRAMIVGPDDRVYVASLAPYGQTGGALGIYDPKTDTVVENYRHIVTNQSLSALCWEPQTKRLFVGSDIHGGGGAASVARQSVVFSWDPQARRKEWEAAVIPGDRSIGALAAAHGKVFGVSAPSNKLFVLDARTHEVLARVGIPLGALRDVSLGYYAPHDRLYALAGQSVVAIDPKTFALIEVARSPEPITCGFALTESGLYFGSGSRLVRWRWN
jgi:streptogramin lyase